jgi:hypothetical protein
VSNFDTRKILEDEISGSVNFFLHSTNLDPASQGYGMAIDCSNQPGVASIASVGFALTAWVIAAERGILSREHALQITRKTLYTLLHHASHHRGFFAHFLEMDSAKRIGRCEYSTIDTSLCLNGVITAQAYFQDQQVSDLAQEILDRVDWKFLIFEMDGRTLFHMAYNPDADGDYSQGNPGYIYQWEMAAEQKMMYLQAATQLDPGTARKLYQGFARDLGEFEGQKIIINPGGNLFAYHFSEAWLDTASYLDPDGVDWFNNSRLAGLANRAFCIQHAGQFKSYGPDSWGCSAGDSPWGYDVSGSTPNLNPSQPNGTVSIFSALSCLPFMPAETLSLLAALLKDHPQTWGPYGFYDSYNLDVEPAWYSSSLYGINKGCSMIMIQNYLDGMVWKTYTNSTLIQKALSILEFTRR